MLTKINYSSYHEAQHFRIYNKQLGLKGVKCLMILKKNEFLSCDTKRGNMDSTDSALDEIVSYSCMNTCLYVQDFQYVLDFFHLLSNFTY